MGCPACGVSLDISDRQGVEIDHCPSCRGVWLDRGELDKIIELTTLDIGPERAFSARKPNRRGGNLKDLFDF